MWVNLGAGKKKGQSSHGPLDERGTTFLSPGVDLYLYTRLSEAWWSI